MPLRSDEALTTLDVTIKNPLARKTHWIMRSESEAHRDSNNIGLGTGRKALWFKKETMEQQAKGKNVKRWRGQTRTYTNPM